MTTPKASNGNNLKQTIKNTPHAEQIEKLEAFLQINGQRFPYQFAMRALFDFITHGEPLTMESIMKGFINDIKTLLYDPEVLKKFYAISNITPLGLGDYLSRFKEFFSTVHQKEVLADIVKFGLLEDPNRYLHDEHWDGADGAISFLQGDIY